MAKTATPIYPQTPYTGVNGVLLTTAMTAAKAWDGTEAVGTSMALVGTFGAEGGRLDVARINFTSTAGAAPSGTTNATLVRFWANSGGVNTTAANNQLIGQVEIPPVNVSTAISTNAALEEVIAAFYRSFPASVNIYAGLVTAIGGTNCALTINLDAGQY